MMEKIYNLFTDDELKFISEMNPEFENNLDIDNLIFILKQVGCDEKTIKHIILSNPKYLTNDYLSVLELINTLYKLGITNLYTVFESNPYILNKEKFQIDEFINKKLTEGKQLEEIVDIIDSNPYILDEE